MTLELDVLLFSLLFGYLGCFLLLGAAKGRAYFRTDPSNNKDEIGEREITDFERSEVISLTLAGFSIAALSFVISTSEINLATVETLITFFSLSLVFEITSSLCYHHADLRLYKFLGFVFQFAGLLAILGGFFGYLVDRLPPNSYQIILVYSGALVLFLWLTGRELRHYLRLWNTVNEIEGKRRLKETEKDLFLTPDDHINVSTNGETAEDQYRGAWRRCKDHPKIAFMAGESCPLCHNEAEKR